ncbi:MAG: SpoVG family protein [Planctomyces sp.]|nr:SpoVG family protein [Planctomyces sp.]
MEITEVRIKLVTDLDERLRAFCSITFDGEFVIRDLKVIEGQKGYFVAMPSRKLMEKCQHCTAKNEVRARFCCNCGKKLNSERPATISNQLSNGQGSGNAHGSGNGGKNKMYADIAHPINPGCRDRIEFAVIEAYKAEKDASQKPGYQCRYDDYDDHAA